MTAETDLNNLPDWNKLHFDATLIDLHTHPALKAGYFYRSLGKRVYPSPRAFDPLAVHTNFPRLHEGGVDVLLSVVYALSAASSIPRRPSSCCATSRPACGAKSTAAAI